MAYFMTRNIKKSGNTHDTNLLAKTLIFLLFAFWLMYALFENKRKRDPNLST